VLLTWADSLVQVQLLLVRALNVVTGTTADGSCTVVMGGMQWKANSVAGVCLQSGGGVCLG